MKKNLPIACTLTVLSLSLCMLSNASEPVALTLWPSTTTGPFFGIQVSGSAFKAPVTLRFDTEGRTLIVPAGCINPNNITVIDANTRDEWGNPAELVTGQVTLTAKDGTTQYTVNNLPFFVDKGQDCSTGFNNFGASMNAYYPGGKAPCLGNFFGYYNYANGMSPGFSIQAYQMANTQSANLLIGTVLPGNYSYQLPYRSTASCVGGQTLPLCYGYQHWGTSIPGVTLLINGVEIPNYEAMIDTGGGMMIIRDNAEGTYTNALQKHLQACPANISFLTHCECLNPNTPVSVTFGAGPNNVQYQYTASTFAYTQQSAVAICPDNTFGPNSPNAYVFPNGVNLGFNLFNDVQSVSYNFTACTVNISS